MSASAPVFRILKQFRIDKSRIPADKLEDPRIINSEASINLELADETYRLQVCLHEAAHAIYMERADLKSVLLGPSISYDHERDKVARHNATVAATHFISSGIPLGSHLSIDEHDPIPLRQCAKWTVAGGVVMRRLTNFDDEGDKHDKEAFFSECRVITDDETQTVKEGMPEDEIHRLWDQAQAAVEKDLRSPAFRHQLWDRAREFKCEFDSKYKYVGTPPEYFVTALDDVQDKLDGNGNQIVSFSVRVLDAVREQEAA